MQLKASILFMLVFLLFVSKQSFLFAETEENSQTTQIKNFVSIHFPEPTSVKDLSKAMGLWLGKTIMFEPSLSETVQILAPKKVSVYDAYQIFLSALDYVGLMAIDKGSRIEIVRKKSITQQPLPLREVLSEKSLKPVIHVIHLKNLDSAFAKKTLGQVFGNTVVQEYTDSNLLIVIDTENKIEKIKTTLDFLDVSEQSRDTVIIPILYAQAKTIETQIKSLFAQDKGKTVLVVSDERSQRIFLFGKKEKIELIQKAIKKLDEPFSQADQNSGGIYVVPIFHRPVKSVMDLLTQVRSGDKQKDKQDVQFAIDESTNAILIKAPRDTYQTLRRLIQKIDQKKAQVFFAINIIECLREDAYDLVSSSLLGSKAGKTNQVYGWQGQHIAPMVIGSQIGADGVKTAVSAYRDSLTISVIPQAQVNVPGLGSISPQLMFKALKTNTEAYVISSPYLFASDHEQANLSVGQVLYFSSTKTDAMSMTTSLTQKENVELSLSLEPKMTEDKLTVKITLDGTEVSGFSADGLPILQKKKTSQTVLVDHGQSVILSGLEKTSQQSTVSKVPLLGDIPLLGILFRGSSDKGRRDHMLIQLTPYMIHGAEDFKRVFDSLSIDSNFAKSSLINMVHPGKEITQ